MQQSWAFTPSLSLFFRPLKKDLQASLTVEGGSRHAGLWETPRVCFLSYNLSKMFIMAELWRKAQQYIKQLNVHCLAV